jgi:hypothetical protein
VEKTGLEDDFFPTGFYEFCSAHLLSFHPNKIKISNIKPYFCIYSKLSYPSDFKQTISYGEPRNHCDC